MSRQRSRFRVLEALVPRRRSDPELMDAPGLPVDEVADAYATLQRINRQLGNNRSIDQEAARFAKEEQLNEAVSTLDVGAGSGDISRRLVRKLSGKLGYQTLAIALDRDRTAATLARSSEQHTDDSVQVIQGDALRLPMLDCSVDLVTAVKFAHHFEGQSLARLLSEMARVARSRVVVLDIERHWVAYWGFVTWSRLFTKNRLVRYDGPLSVLRGFQKQELEDLAQPLVDFSWEVRRKIGFQIVLVGRRRTTPKSI